MKNLCRKNRKKLAQIIGKGLILLSSGREKQRNSDVDYLFRQDSDFLYFSGVTEPHHLLLIEAPSGRSHLIIPDLSEKHRIWVGHQMTTREAASRYGVDDAHYASDFKKTFLKLSRGRSVYALENTFPVLRHHKIRVPATALAKKFRTLLNEQRVRKSPEEIELMRTANRISREGHVAAMRFTKPGVSEFQVQAVMEREFFFHGALHNAYPSIVAAGSNAAILHYHSHNAPCRNGELLLIDAGCELNGYASDITRTFPVNGRFTKEQREIYTIVLDAQKECIEKIRPGISMLDLHRHACRSMSQGLLDLGILKGSLDDIMKEEIYAIFFPHGIGHLLGLDVHDVGAKDPKAKPIRNKPKTLRASRVLEPDFVVTVEPGLYFIDAHFESKETRKRTAKFIDWKKAEVYRGVGGIRIEDDILVTRKGYENLTTVPKEINEIEKIMLSGISKPELVAHAA